MPSCLLLLAPGLPHLQHNLEETRGPVKCWDILHLSEGAKDARMTRRMGEEKREFLEGGYKART